VWIAPFSLLKGRHIEPQLKAVCVYGGSVCMGRGAHSCTAMNWCREDEREELGTSWGELWAREEPRHTVTHQRKNSDTIISLGYGSPILLIKIRLLNHQLISPFPFYSLYHSFSATEPIRGGIKIWGRLWESAFCDTTQMSSEHSWMGSSIHLLLAHPGNNRCARCTVKLNTTY